MTISSTREAIPSSRRSSCWNSDSSPERRCPTACCSRAPRSGRSLKGSARRRLRDLSRRFGSARRPMTPRPLLFFHGDWSWGGFYVEHLARKLGREISLIAVAPHGPGGEPIPPSIEAMAADRLAAILEAQPTGPYRLAGHCVGGIVAFETARLLTNLNHQVETVVMIDSPVMVGGER